MNISSNRIRIIINKIIQIFVNVKIIREPLFFLGRKAYNKKTQKDDSNS